MIIEKRGNINFGPYVAYYKIHNELLNGLTKRGEKCTPGSGNKNLAGVIEDQRGYKMEDKKWFIKEFQLYIDDYVESSISFIGQQFNEVQHSKKFTLIDLWINYMKQNEDNPEHTHSGMLSWIMYLQTPDLTEERAKYEGKSIGPGGTTFHYGEHSHPKWAEHTYLYQPEVRGLWIFPAQLRHQVISFKTKGERISVSGNLFFVHPNDESTVLKEIK